MIGELYSFFIKDRYALTPFITNSLELYRSRLSTTQNKVYKITICVKIFPLGKINVDLPN